MGGREGLATAVELAGGIGDLGLGGDGQAELFADADDAPMPMPSAAIKSSSVGRPAGARNRSTEEWRRFLLSKYRSPLVFLLEAYSRTPRELAEQLELYKFHEGKLVMSPKLDANGARMFGPEGEELWEPVLATGEAASLQMQAAIAALPYLHQKQPMAIETKTETRGLVIIGDLGGDNGGEVDAFALPLATDHQPKQNQEVTDLEPEKSDDEKSEAQPNQLIYREENQNEQ